MKVIILTIVFMASNWLWDVSQVAYHGGHMFLNNGFWEVPSSQVFHASWYFVMALFIILAIYAELLE